MGKLNFFEKNDYVFGSKNIYKLQNSTFLNKMPFFFLAENIYKWENWNFLSLNFKNALSCHQSAPLKAISGNAKNSFLGFHSPYKINFWEVWHAFHEWISFFALRLFWRQSQCNIPEVAILGFVKAKKSVFFIPRNLF